MTKVLEGVENHEVREANFEALRLALNATGAGLSPAYLHGLAGSAFRIGGICPCAPTCTLAMSPSELLRLLGYGYTEYPYDGSDKEGALAKAVAAVCASIDAGVPALVWHAFQVCEWDVVTGYDRAEEAFIGKVPWDAACTVKRPWKNTLDTFAAQGPMAIVIGRGGRPDFDGRAAEVAALREAVRHANDPENADKAGGGEWVFLQGKAAYGRWAGDFADPARKKGHGDAYCADIYPSAHAQAGPFLRGIAPGYPKAEGALAKAASLFELEATKLAEAKPLLGWDAPEEDAGRNAKAAAILSEAAGLYGEAMDALAAALADMGE
ncbi:MAG: hypothetical protein FWE70_03830 [Oscillospiraceae bacterium]|nr:hypothetical protein [Oscillospiraceae bacterium]